MDKKIILLGAYGYELANNLLLIYVIIFILSNLSPIMAQNKKHPWGIGISGNLLKYKSNSYMPAGGLYVNRQMSPTLSFQSFCLFSHNQKFPFKITENDSVGNLADLSFMLQLRLNNGSFLKENARFTPYIFFGFGGNYVKSNSDVYVPLGIGTQVRLNDRMNVLFNYTKKLSLNRTPEHSSLGLGLVYNFSKTQPFIYADYGTEPIQPTEVFASMSELPSILETDEPPKISNNTELEQNKWVFRSALFSDKEKLQVLRQNQIVMIDAFQKRLDSMEAWNYIGDISFFADSLQEFKSFFLSKNLHDSLVGELDDLDGVVFYGKEKNDSSNLQKNVISDTIGSLDNLNSNATYKPTKIDSIYSQKDSSFLDKKERNLTSDNLSKIDTFSLAFVKRLSQMNCYDLKTNVLYVGFQDSSEVAQDNATWQLSEIGNLLQKCKIIKVHLYYGLGENEAKDEIRDIQRMDFVRLSLMFDYDVTEDRIIESKEYAPLNLKSSNAIINKMGKIVVVFE
jgi:hypothetical protein